MSVIVCTLDRQALLAQAIVSLRCQDLPADAFEVIVVDNSPRDGARATVESLAWHPPKLSYEHEPVTGLSNARNRGLAVSRAEVVAFLDDDAVAGAGWLTALLAAFDSGHRLPICVGGKVAPIWEKPRPRWLDDSLLRFLSVVDYGDERRECRWPEKVLVGCNVAFEAKFLRDTGGFDPALGRRGASSLGKEEASRSGAKLAPLDNSVAQMFYIGRQTCCFG